MKKGFLQAAAGMTLTAALSAQVIVLDDFTGGGPTGILAGTSWSGGGNVVANGSTITVGNTALNDNGWGTFNATIDATGMSFLTVVAQRGGGNAAPSLVIGFEDSALNSQVFSIPMPSFATGQLTSVEIPIYSWGDVNPMDLTGWTIGGGTAGVVSFGMTFDSLSLSSSSSAVPEPGAYAALAGVCAIGFVGWRRRARLFPSAA